MNKKKTNIQTWKKRLRQEILSSVKDILTGQCDWNEGAKNHFLKKFLKSLRVFLNYASKHRGDSTRMDGVKISMEINQFDWIDNVIGVNERLIKIAVSLNEIQLVRDLNHFRNLIQEITNLSSHAVVGCFL